MERNRNYTLSVHSIRTDATTGEGTVILELDGKLSARAKRDLKAAIEDGRVTLRQSVRTIA